MLVKDARLREGHDEFPALLAILEATHWLEGQYTYSRRDLAATSTLLLFIGRMEFGKGLFFYLYPTLKQPG
jgi:hypothetical protein